MANYSQLNSSSAASYGDRDFSYDASGNVLSDGVREFTYNGNDKLTKVVANGNRSTLLYAGEALYYQLDETTVNGQQVEYERHIAGAFEKKVRAGGASNRTEYRYAIADDLVIVEDGQGARDTYILFKDHLGSVFTVANINGNIVSQQVFDAFGQARPIYSSAPLQSGALMMPTEQGYTGHRQMTDFGFVHMQGRIYDPTLGRFLQADPHIQAPLNSQSHNRYAYVLNNPLSYTDPSGYFFSKLWKGVKKFAGVIVVAVASWYCAGTCTTAMWSLIGGAAGAASAAANGGNIMTGALAGMLTAGVGAGAGSGWGGFFANGFAGGVASMTLGGKFGHGFWSAGLGVAAGGQINGIKTAIGRVVASAVVGGTLSKITGGKFANGASSAAFAKALGETRSHYRNQASAKVNRSKVLELSSMTGESASLFDGKVEVAEWGALAGDVSGDDLATVKGSLDDIFASEGGKEIIEKLSAKSPLKILLNNIGENFGRLNGRIMTVDLNTNLSFYNLASEIMPLTRFSLTRIIAHEMGHAVMGIADTNNANVLFTDKIMSEINGTQRQQYSNACTINSQGSCI